MSWQHSKSCLLRDLILDVKLCSGPHRLSGSVNDSSYGTSEGYWASQRRIQEKGSVSAENYIHSKLKICVQQMQSYHKILAGRDKVYAERIKARWSVGFHAIHLTVMTQNKQKVRSWCLGAILTILIIHQVWCRLCRSRSPSSEAGKSFPRRFSRSLTLFKSSGHVHDRHAERSARQYDQQKLDMLNSKKYVPNNIQKLF